MSENKTIMPPKRRGPGGPPPGMMVEKPKNLKEAIRKIFAYLAQTINQFVLFHVEQFKPIYRLFTNKKRAKAAFYIDFYTKI